jgi:hypothetical protein
MNVAAIGASRFRAHWTRFDLAVCAWTMAATGLCGGACDADHRAQQFHDDRRLRCRNSRFPEYEALPRLRRFVVPAGFELIASECWVPALTGILE